MTRGYLFGPGMLVLLVTTLIGCGQAEPPASAATALTQVAYVKAPAPGDGDQFGAAVAVSADGSTMAVGAPGEGSAARAINGDQANNDADDSGAVYVYTRSNGTWTPQAFVKASNADSLDQSAPRGAQRGRPYAGCRRVLRGRRRPRRQRQPGGQHDRAGRRGVCLRAARDGLDAAGLPQGIEYRRGRRGRHLRLFDCRQRRRQHGGGGGSERGRQRQRDQREPGGQFGRGGGCGLRVHAARRCLVAAGIREVRRARGSRSRAICSAIRWR